VAHDLQDPVHGRRRREGQLTPAPFAARLRASKSRRPQSARVALARCYAISLR
jgi:hypothetical protein